MRTMLILAVNSGSSSIKCAVVDPDSGETRFSAFVENLGTRGPHHLVERDQAGKRSREIGASDHQSAFESVICALNAQPEMARELVGVGHRVVHGGESFHSSALIDAEVEQAIERAAALAPLHNPGHLLGIRAARHALPELPHVAVFDTAFHQTLPEFAFRYAVPEAWYKEYGIRRYGFHGTSHRYVAHRASELLGREPADLNLITAHLGNGCSLAAIQGGRSIDTTMGFTPLDGLVMGTRSGDLDPAIVFHLMERGGLSAREIETALIHESGLFGLSGLTSDVRILSARSEEGHPGAKLALEVFCHRLAKHIGALATNFDRLDGLVFTAGIGENSALIRRMACARLGSLGIVLDDEKNGRNETRIDAPESKSAVLVVPTNEELMIARDTRELALGLRP